MIHDRIFIDIGTGISNAITFVWATETAEHTSRGQFVAIEFVLNIFGVVVACWIEYGTSFCGEKRVVHLTIKKGNVKDYRYRPTYRPTSLSIDQSIESISSLKHGYSQHVPSYRLSLSANLEKYTAFENDAYACSFSFHILLIFTRVGHTP